MGGWLGRLRALAVGLRMQTPKLEVLGPLCFGHLGLTGFGVQGSEAQVHQR